MSFTLASIRQADLGSKKTGGRHHTQDFSSETALKRKIHMKVVRANEKVVLFGANSNGQSAPNKGNYSDYIYFKNTFANFSLSSVSKQ
tara:strand:+ start:9768 stop:10031 length:264 start_codon:yes stop_codon:yes gene_type:complete